MKARFVRLTIAVVGLLLINTAARAQYDGVANVSGPYGGYGGYPAAPITWGNNPSGYDSHGKMPLTGEYVDGPARWAYGDLSGDRGGLYENSPMDEFVKDLVTDSFFRIEYLNWTMKKPGDTLLGSGTNATLNPRRPFRVSSGNALLGEARVLSTTRLELDNLDGIRATLGIPLVSGTIEGSIYAFEDSHTTDGVFSGLGEPAPGNVVVLPQFIANTTLTNGVQGTNAFLYDSSYRMAFRNRVWGSDINYVLEAYDPNPGLQLRPLIGIRYYDQSENFTQIGVFDDDGQIPELSSEIHSDSTNHVYLAQIGLRAELVSRWLTVGLEPKVGLGVNDYESSVSTIRLRSQGDPAVRTEDSGARIAPFGELALYSRIHISENFSISVGYTVVIIDNITRPHSSILYNDNGPSNPAGFVVAPSFDTMYYQGINVGGELRF
jgi:hypothetical protein